MRLTVGGRRPDFIDVRLRSSCRTRCFSGSDRPPFEYPTQVRSYPDRDEGNVAVNFWFRNVTSFAEEERDVLGIGADPRGGEL